MHKMTMLKMCEACLLGPAGYAYDRGLLAISRSRPLVAVKTVLMVLHDIHEQCEFTEQHIAQKLINTGHLQETMPV